MGGGGGGGGGWLWSEIGHSANVIIATTFPPPKVDMRTRWMPYLLTSNFLRFPRLPVSFADGFPIYGRSNLRHYPISVYSVCFQGIIVL